MISISIEQLRDGNIRVTGRHDGRTVHCMDGSFAKDESMLAEVMSETAGHHRYPDGSYDLTHIQLNEQANAVYWKTRGWFAVVQGGPLHKQI